MENPDISFLIPKNSANWICFNKPLDIISKRNDRLITSFRKVVDYNGQDCSINYLAFKGATVFLDDNLIHQSDNIKLWKNLNSFSLPRNLSPGKHTLRIDVKNLNASPALIVYSKDFNFKTDTTWEASNDGRTWTRAILAGMNPSPIISQEFLPSTRVLASNFILLAVLFSTIFILCTLNATSKILKSIIPSPSILRWLLIAVWTVISINNIIRLPLYIGMDIREQIEYMEYIANNWRFPLATDGWQMCHPPLYYSISALFLKLFQQTISLATTLRLLRILPCLCGLLQIELCYRIVKYTFPEREDLQNFAILIGASIPANIYISQVVGNEPLVGIFTAALIVRLAKGLSSHFIRTDYISFGVLLGLALLTKITPVILTPLILITITYNHFIFSEFRPQSSSIFIQHVILMLIVTVAISGWYYFRNLIELGTLYMAGENPARGIAWWQDPGYRTLQQSLSFGKSLFNPIYAVNYSFWDALYSTFWADGLLSGTAKFSNIPPWNYRFLISNVWLALLPTMLIGLGIFKSIGYKSSSERSVLLFSAACIMLYLAAIFYRFVTVPYLCGVKASYANGILPCIALLCATGFDHVARNVIIKRILISATIVWMIFVLFSFFILVNPDPYNSHFYTFMGDSYAKIEKHKKAIQYYSEELLYNPNNFVVHNHIGVSFIKSGQFKQAIKHFEDSIRINPEYCDAYFNLKTCYEIEGRRNEATELVNRKFDSCSRNGNQNN